MKQEKELKRLLTEQKFNYLEYDPTLLESAKSYALAYSRATEGAAVVSDFHNNICYIYAGRFAQSFFGLPEYMEDNSTAFENEIFDKVVKDDLLERHILEIRFFSYLKNVPACQKSEYLASCSLRLYNQNPSDGVQILHTTRYLNCLSNGSILCGLCTYSPFPITSAGISGGIVNIYTGITVSAEAFQQSTRNLLSKRQKEILGFLAKGFGSKQIAECLNISFNTVNRHRQDILSVLRVNNTVAAVEIGLRMNLI